MKFKIAMHQTDALELATKIKEAISTDEKNGEYIEIKIHVDEGDYMNGYMNFFVMRHK